MILVDTSVWVDHLRSGNARLRSLLLAEAVTCHPFVVGELACGSLRRRDEVLRLLSDLTMCPMVPDTEVLALVENRRLFGRGIGWIDAHLLASAMSARCSLWTRDRRLDAIAGEFELSARED